MENGNNGEIAVPEFDLRHYLNVINKWKWVFVFLVLASMLVAGLLSKFVLPKVYEATAEIMVSAAGNQQAQVVTTQNGLDAVLGNLSGIPQATVDTYVGEMTGNALLSQVALRLPPSPGGERYTYLNLQKMIKVSVVQGSNLTDTNLINVQVSNTDPRLAAFIANTLVADFIQFISNQNKVQMSGSVAFLQNQAKSLGAKLAAANRELSNLQASADVTQLQSQLASEDTTVSNLQTSLQDAQVSLAEEQAAAAYLQGELGSLSPTSPIYATVQGNLIVAQTQAAQAQARVVTIQGQADQTAMEIGTLQQTLAAASLKQQALQNQVAMLTTAYQTVQSKETDATVAEAANLGKATVSVVSSALVPTVPSQPKTMNNVLVAGVLGFLLAGVLVLLLEYLDSTVKFPEDVERAIGVGTLGVIPRVSPVKIGQSER